VLLRQFIKFTGVGLIATAIHYAILTLGVMLGAGPVWASSLGFVLSALVNYDLNRRHTFRSDRRHREALPRFAAVAGVGLLLNAAIMGLATGALHWHFLLAQVMATGLVLLWNFSINRVWTFRTVKSLKNA